MQLVSCLQGSPIHRLVCTSPAPSMTRPSCSNPPPCRRRALSRTVSRASSSLQRAGSGLQRAGSGMRRLGRLNDSARRSGSLPLSTAPSLPAGGPGLVARAGGDLVAGSLSVPIGESDFQAAANAAVAAAAAGTDPIPQAQPGSPGQGLAASRSRSAMHAIARLLPRSRTRSRTAAQAGRAPADLEGAGNAQGAPSHMHRSSSVQ